MGLKLTKVDSIPASGAGKRPSMYCKAIDEFLKSGFDKAEIDYPSKMKAITVHRGLTSALAKYFQGAPVKLVKRGDALFFVRTDESSSALNIVS